MIKLRNVINKIKKSNSSIQETNYLLSSKANAKHLKKSIKQLNDGKTIKIKLKDLWK
jgi:PHD/YefM family antitoxin component YafN of YafNO toxin-antitoxin module